MNERAAAEHPADQGEDGMSIFTFSKPLKMLINGVSAELHGVGMRAFESRDLPLLDRFHGKPIALAQNVVAALCSMSIEEVQSLDLEDFTPLAEDALWQVSRVAVGIGLTAEFFLHPTPPAHMLTTQSPTIPANPAAKS